MANVSEWSTTAASNNDPSPDGFPEGMAPSGVNDAAREVMAAVSKWYTDSRGALTSAGTSTAYTLTTNNAHAALSDVPITVFLANVACGASPTLNIDSLGAKTLKKRHDVDLAANDIEASQLVVVAYNSTDDTYEVLSPIATSADVITTQGDVITGDASGDPQRVALGTAGLALTSDGTDAVYARPYGVTQIVSAVNTAVVSTSTSIPNDDTIPTWAEGENLSVQVSITPTHASNRLLIMFHAQGTNSGGQINNFVSLFKNGTGTDPAIAATFFTSSSANNLHQFGIIHERSAGGTSAQTYDIRYGPGAGSGTFYINGRSGSPSGRMGAASEARLTVMDIKSNG